jgi:hypothetical protein
METRRRVEREVTESGVRQEGEQRVNRARDVKGRDREKGRERERKILLLENRFLFDANGRADESVPY